MITTMLAKRFSHSIIPSAFIIDIYWKEELSLLTYLFVSEWAHGILFCPVGYNHQQVSIIIYFD